MVPTRRENNHLGGGARLVEHPFVLCLRVNRDVVVAAVIPALIAQHKVVAVLACSDASVGVCDVDFAFDVELIIRTDLVPEMGLEART
jgi:hypothetical protein